MHQLGTALLVALACAGLARSAPADEAFDAAVRAAMQAPQRPAEDAARDANRKPAETLAFLGIEGDMRVLELVPGGGWYTRLLAPALAGKGELHAWIGIERFADRLSDPAFAGVRRVAQGATLQPTDRRGIFELAPLSFGVSGLDAVLTFRNLHNLTPSARANLHRAVFEALRPGGVYGVVDHTRRHMQPDDPENRRRLDPVVAIREITDAGFVFEAWSDLHYRPDDELRYEVGRRSVTGNTDRFTFRFRKPE